MGNNLSPILAIIYMNFIEEQIKEKCGDQIIIWRRYIDDIFVVSLSPIDDILPLINDVDTNIQFTIELPVDNQLPFSDTKVARSQDNSFHTGFYSKDIHSNHIMPWESWVPWQRKINLLRTECLRVHRNCSTKSKINDGLYFMKKDFLQTGTL